MKWSLLAGPFLLPVALLGCEPKPEADDQPAAAENPTGDPSPPAAALEDREWILGSIGDQPAPSGSGGRPATVQFDGTNRRAAGFAGCNRYSAAYTLAGDSLSFGPAVATRMACADGDELERRYLAVLPEVKSFELTDSTLALSGSGGVLARFRAP